MIPAMPIVRDQQTTTLDGQQVVPVPEGTVVRDLVTHTDERGTVCELYDLRWGVSPEELVFAYMFTIRPGMAKGWGIHHEHDDRYAFLCGEAELALYDAREDSATAGQEFRVVLSELHRRLITIPRGVWHAERNLGGTDVRVVNFPTIPYDHENPDKYRLPLNTDELPVRLGPDWRGW
jgi:dTDP-4-dehydrorhamnose 3,5-epimerase